MGLTVAGGDAPCARSRRENGGPSMKRVLQGGVAALGTLASIAALATALVYFGVIPNPIPSGTETINDSDGRIIYVGQWTHQGQRGLGDYSDDLHFTQAVGDYAELTFDGTQFEFIAEKAPDHGLVTIYLDGSE